MADFSRRVRVDELRGRGLMKGLQPENLEQISSWPSAQAHGCEACTRLIAYTSGSACMTRAWPRLAVEAGLSSHLRRGRVRSLVRGGQWRQILLLSCSWARLDQLAQSPKLLPSRRMPPMSLGWEEGRGGGNPFPKLKPPKKRKKEKNMGPRRRRREGGRGANPNPKLVTCLGRGG